MEITLNEAEATQMLEDMISNKLQDTELLTVCIKTEGVKPSHPTDILPSDRWARIISRMEADDKILMVRLIKEITKDFSLTDAKHFVEQWLPRRVTEVTSILGQVIQEQTEVFEEPL